MNNFGLGITNIIKDSFQEYEGEWSLVLFSRGCNLRCKGCYNISNFENDTIKKNIYDIIDENLTPLHTAVVFLGGEPTIWNENLINACMYVKNVKKLKVKLFTNGLNFDVVKKLNDLNLVDSFSLDFKTLKNIDFLGNKNLTIDFYLDSLDKCINNIMMHDKNIELRTTLFSSILDEKEEISNFIYKKYPNVKHIFQKEVIFSEMELKYA